MATTAQLNDVKSKYKEFLFTEKGKRLISHSIRIKKAWEQDKKLGYTCDFSTSCVKTIPAGLKHLVKKVDITPIGFNNCCHYTSQSISDSSDFDYHLGYSMLACQCGKLLTFELHCVNSINGTFYDFTNDYNGETSKYFLKFDCSLDFEDFIDKFGQKFECVYVDFGCECMYDLRDKNKMRLSEFLKYVKSKKLIV